MARPQGNAASQIALVMEAAGAKPKYAMCPARKKIYNDCIEWVPCNLPLWAQAERARLIRLSEYGGHLGKRHPLAQGIQLGVKRAFLRVHLRDGCWSGIDNRANGSNAA